MLLRRTALSSPALWRIHSQRHWFRVAQRNYAVNKETIKEADIAATYEAPPPKTEQTDFSDIPVSEERLEKLKKGEFQHAKNFFERNANSELIWMVAAGAFSAFCLGLILRMKKLRLELYNAKIKLEELSEKLDDSAAVPIDIATLEDGVVALTQQYQIKEPERFKTELDSFLRGFLEAPRSADSDTNTSDSKTPSQPSTPKPAPPAVPAAPAKIV
jgi:hypothetical protein